MSNYIKAHGLSIAQGGAIENAVLETLTTAPASLETGRLYYDSTAGEVKYVKRDGGTATVFTVASKEDAQSLIDELAAVTGATLVGAAGTTGTNGEFSTVDGTVQTELDALVTGLDQEIKDRKDGVTAEANARIAADTAINTEITALKDGSTSTIKDLDDADAAQVARLVTLEDLVDGDMGDFSTLTNLVDYGSGEVAPTSLVDAINAVDSDLTAEAARASEAESVLETSITDLTDYTDANFLNKTTATTQAIAADVAMSGSLTVTGDLTVNGGNFVTEAEIVTFADNVLTLNSNVTTGTASENAGLEVSRGDEGNLSIFTWNELTDYTTVPVFDADANEGAGGFTQQEIATKPYTEANFVAINDALDVAAGEIQTELDATQVGAGLLDDGTYSADASTNYITTATTLKNADKLLDAQVKVLEDGLSNEEIARTDADIALDDRLTTVEEQVNGKIGDLENLTNTDNDTGIIATNVVDAINDVDADLTLEVTRAQATEASISGVITALKDGSTSTIADLNTADATLTTNLNTEISDRQAAVLAEQTARENADSAINSTITALKAGSTSTIADLDSAIAAEEARATGAEATINTTISTMKTDINAMYYTFTAETTGSTFNIAHNLNSEFVSVQVWVYDDAATRWKNDIVAIEIVDNANLNVYLTEARKVKVIVNKIAGLV